MNLGHILDPLRDVLLLNEVTVISLVSDSSCLLKPYGENAFRSASVQLPYM